MNGIIARLGLASRFFWIMLRLSGTSFRRLPLTIREIYFAGVLSLIIIAVSALFVGMVLGLQGYDTLVRYGSRTRSGRWSRSRWCASSGRSWRGSCSRAAPARPSPRRSA